MSRIYFLMLTLGMSLLACQNTDVKEDLLYGQWTLKEGFRNEKPSALLQGIYFKMNKPNAITTNFLGEEENGQFELVKDKLTVSASQKTKFDVVVLTENELELKTIIRGTPFRFVLEKE